MIQNNFLETVSEYSMFSPGDLVLVAVSGGADSTALLHLLHENSKQLGITLHVAHLNHLLRKGEAEMDVKFVEGLAQKLGVPVSFEKIDVAAVARQNKRGIEETARETRYQFFEKLARQIGASKVAVGHTADDNVETFLMRLLRGSGLKGLCGIPPKRGMIVRPLIKVWRKEIEDYVGKLKLVPRRDHTNYESKYIRNSVRLKLVPQLKIYNLNIKEIILQTILLLTEDRLYLESEAMDGLKDVMINQRTDEIRIDIAKLRKKQPSLVGHMLRQAVEMVKGDLVQMSFQNIRDIINKLDATEKWELHLPGGIYAWGERGELLLCREKPKAKAIKPFRYILNLPGAVAIEEAGRVLRGDFVEKFKDENNPEVAYVDYSVLGREIVVRSRLPGDRFSPLGLTGSKKLQDFFIDEKIPAEERDAVPVIESGGKIIWVGGCRLDENAKVTAKTEKIVRFELR
jgi:tRNA(Ile)-lysidine synthase